MKRGAVINGNYGRLITESKEALSMSDILQGATERKRSSKLSRAEDGGGHVREDNSKSGGARRSIGGFEVKIGLGRAAC